MSDLEGVIDQLWLHNAFAEDPWTVVLPQYGNSISGNGPRLTEKPCSFSGSIGIL
jgi:hypothetical protein